MAISREQSRLSSLVTTVSGSLVTASFTVIACGSFAALIFSGPLDKFVAQGIWIGLFTAFVVGLVVSLASSYKGAIAIPQDRIAPILALMAGSIMEKMGSASAEDKCLGAIAAIGVVSVVTGLFLFILGRLRLGDLIRYIPYPVIGGFLAGSGWLLVCGAMRVMTGRSLGFAALPALFQTGTIPHWGTGLVFGGLLFFILRRYQHPLTVPLMLIGAIGAFYIVLGAIGGSVANARLSGWLLNFSGVHGGGGFSPLYIAN